MVLLLNIEMFSGIIISPSARGLFCEGFQIFYRRINPNNKLATSLQVILNVNWHLFTGLRGSSVGEGARITGWSPQLKPQLSRVTAADLVILTLL